jgi:hypothetical protein
MQLANCAFFLSFCVQFNIFRWVSRVESDKILVLCPHLEMMEASRAAREDWEFNLKESFCFDGVHLTWDGYRELGNLVWRLIHDQSWKLRPPFHNMPSPNYGRYEALTVRSASKCTRKTRWDAGDVTGQPATQQVAVVADSELRAAEMGPWRSDNIQYSGPAITAEEWGMLRDAAQKSGYSGAAHSRRYLPG